MYAFRTQKSDIAVHIDDMLVCFLCSSSVPIQCLPTWAIPQLQTCDWVFCTVVPEDAVLTAREADEPVKHALLDKVRECSANPDAAADFFLQMLDPTPSWRMSIEAASNSYVAETCAEMEAYCEHAPVTTEPL